MDFHVKTDDFFGALKAIAQVIGDNRDYVSELDAATGEYTYTLNAASEALKAGEVVTETFAYTVTDDQGATVTKELTITVTGTNDAPVAEDISKTLTEQGDPASGYASVAGSLFTEGNVSDVDHDATRSYSVDKTAGRDNCCSALREFRCGRYLQPECFALDDGSDL